VSDTCSVAAHVSALSGTPRRAEIEDGAAAACFPILACAGADVPGAGLGRAHRYVLRARGWAECGVAWSGDLSVIAAANHEAECWIAAILYLIGA
jgi:hypothetical protein